MSRQPFKLDRHIDRLEQIAEDDWNRYQMARATVAEIEMNHPALRDPLIESSPDLDEKIGSGYLAALATMEKTSARLMNNPDRAATVLLKMTEQNIKAYGLVPAPDVMMLFNEFYLETIRFLSDADREEWGVTLAGLRARFMREHPGMAQAIDAVRKAGNELPESDEDAAG